MTDKLPMAGHTFANRVSITVSFDETLLPRSVNLSSSSPKLVDKFTYPRIYIYIYIYIIKDKSGPILFVCRIYINV